jgi:hypothetical protein
MSAPFVRVLHRTDTGAVLTVAVTDRGEVIYEDHVVGYKLLLRPSSAVEHAQALAEAAAEAVANTCLVCGTYAPGQGQECSSCAIADDAKAVRRDDGWPADG